MRHSVLNAEAFTAVLFLFILLLRIRSAVPRRNGAWAHDGILCLGLCAAVAGAFAPAFRMPLLHDSYGHVFTASREGIGDVLRRFVAHPSRGDFFFRPLGLLSFWVDAHWAGYHPLLWHAWSVGLHAVNTCLVFTLARRLSLGQIGSMVAAMMFAIHGSRPEAVAWVAARFDLLAAFFVLLVLLAALRYAQAGGRVWLAVSVPLSAAALLSKESAFCLPLLLLLVLAMRIPRVAWSRIGAVTGTVAVTTAVMFAYRMYVLQGIGGYGAESGAPTILHFNLLRTLNALFFRQWALLFFPIDWESPPSAVLRLMIAVFSAAILALLFLRRGDRRRLLLALAVTVAAALPVQHLLLIGSDLSGARVLYLPVLGLALFWGLLLQELPGRTVQISAASAVVLFQCAALEHNLRIWVEAARLSQRSCAYLASDLPRDGKKVAVLDPPATWRGVYFLKNSLEACIVMNSSGKLSEPPAISANTADADVVYRWSPERFTFLKDSTRR